MKQFSFLQCVSGLTAATVLVLSGCGGGGGGDPYVPPSLSDGVIFTYPIDGQTDVHLGTRFYVTFSKNASQSAVDAACSVDGSGNVTGNFCLIGPGDAVISIAPSVSGKIVQFETDQLQQGTRYELYVRSAVIGGGSTNLPASDPLVTFLTTQSDPVSGVAPTVTAINGEDPDVYSTTLPSPPDARYPMMDFSTMRVEFSEPLDEKTVQVGTSFEFVEVNGATETPVVGAMVVRKQHISFDPDEDLTPGVTYRLRLGSGIVDLNGEAVNPVTYEMVPVNSNSCDCVITQRFNTTAAYGEAGFPQTSRLTGRPLNAIDLYSPLIGSNDINLRDITLEARLADPSAFGGLIPFVIRKGVYLDITGLDLRLGGEVPANLQTGDITASFITDVTGYMDRNPYRPYSTQVDDDKSPIFVYLIFDLALTSADPNGNAVLNQTIPHVQATGTAYIEDGTLYIESVRTLEMDLLGLDRAPAHLVLAINSDLVSTPVEDTVAPTITSAYPGDGSADFPVRDELSLIFSEPMDNAGVDPQDEIVLTNVTDGGQVAFQITWDGSTMLLQPDSPLAYNKTYQITLGALTDLANNALVLDGADATGGDGAIQFSTENPTATTVGPVVSSIHSGAACTLTGADASFAGRCSGGLSGDEKYLPFTIPADVRLEVSFSQPMDLSTLTLGSACGSGAVRVEELDGGGACVGVVDGSLIADTRSFKFVPRNGWVEGTDYRLTLVAGANTSCGAGEICSENGIPLNPDPINGGQSGDAGGGNIVNTFTAVAANNDVFLPLKMQPFSDQNGNGYLDAGETAHSENSAGVAVTGVGGIVVGALIDGDPNIYLSGSLPVTVGEPEPITVDGLTWGMTIAGTSQIPVTVHPGIIYGTSIRLDTTARVIVTIPINNVDTGVSILRLRQAGGEPVTGYIVEEEGVAEPQFIAQLDLYMDAPDMVIEVLGVISVAHDLSSKPVQVTIKGPVEFLEDGRILITPESLSPVDLIVNVSALNLPGSILLQIPSGAMKMSLIGNPLKGRQ
ncbi:Ig-like domain-containing protein [Ketobacter alkanivorans]|uniref:SbsA Ig-like domain-containing protein n=1 Tax=Ketobacter alkanivorans TaxID=1917421 RepID=A0A2K9LME5_9GAMM|nr:Ig-like domain-containing protein [Ketobacter alkanivorans]AUM13410.1 hypothetical protein Kalk_13700 [Ketobacter alkanivorans]